VHNNNSAANAPLLNVIPAINSTIAYLLAMIHNPKVLIILSILLLLKSGTVIDWVYFTITHKAKLRADAIIKSIYELCSVKRERVIELQLVTINFDY